LDAAGVEKAVLLAHGSPGPELAAFFAATHPERTLCLAHYGCLHFRQEHDYPWGDSEEAIAADLADLDEWGSEDDAREFISGPYLRGAEPASPPFDEPEFIAWNAKLCRFAATPASYEAFVRMWYATDVRPLLGSISVPTAMLFSSFDAESEEVARAEARLIPGARLIGVATPYTVIWVHDPEAMVSAIEGFIESVQHEEAALDRKLATVLFTDIVGSTGKACEVGDACWKELLERHDQVTRAMLARYRGTEVKVTGDGFLATFDGPARAVKCAQAICEAVRPLGLEVRAGCHTGEIELLDGDIGGIAVHIGARVGALAGPSEVLVSSTVRDLVAGSGLAFEDRGEHELKGVLGTWRLYSAS
jgi:class 3 adenylate cyclase